MPRRGSGSSEAPHASQTGQQTPTPTQSSAGFELGGTGSTTTQGVRIADALRDCLKDDPCLIHSINFSDCLVSMETPLGDCEAFMHKLYRCRWGPF